MKKKKLLKKLQAFFDWDERKKKAHVEDLIKILKKLKAKEQKISAKLLEASDIEQRKNLQQELSIIDAQRKKGIQLIRKLIKEDDRQTD